MESGSYLIAEFSIDALPSISEAAKSCQSTFFSVTQTPEEISVVCETSALSGSIRSMARDLEEPWTLFRFAETLDFSLTGILAELTVVLADAKIPVFCVSTFRTDYFLVRAEYSSRTRDVLTEVGYQ